MEGAVFGKKYSRDDYGAIMNYARIAPPAPKTNYVDIAGGNSAIDLTEAVGGVVYEDGNIDFLFTLFSFEKAEQMRNDIHGRRLPIVLEREPEYYYDGRATCTKAAHEGRIYELYFTARVQPYKYEMAEYVHVESVEGKEKEILLPNDVMPVLPRIYVKGNILLTYEGMRCRMDTGEYQLPEVTLRDGWNRIRLSGSGTVKFVYRKGRLV